MTVFGGDIILAADLNAILTQVELIDPAPLVEVSAATSTAAISAGTETVFASAASTTFAANSAYEAIIEGGYTMSVSTNVPLFNLRKTNEAGTLIGNFGPRMPAPGTTSATKLLSSVMFQIGGADVTAVVCATADASAGTVTIVGNSQRQRRLRIHYRGPSSAYTNLPTLS